MMLPVIGPGESLSGGLSPEKSSDPDSMGSLTSFENNQHTNRF